MRLFIAFPLNPDFQNFLRSLQTQLKTRTTGSIKWIPPKLCHLTLAFLGHHPSDRLKDAGDACENTCRMSHPITLTTEKPGTFPRNRPPRVLWLGLKASPELSLFQANLHAQLRRKGFTLDERPYHPHISLARIKQTDPNVQWPEVLTEIPAPIHNQICCTLHLVQSRLSQEGPRHQILQSFSLK